MLPILRCCILVALIAAGSARAADVGGNQIVARVRTGHPRVMMTPDTDATIRAGLQNDPWLKARFEEQKRSADRILTQEVSRYEIPDGLRLLATSRRVLERVSTLAIVYRMTDDKRYLDRCRSELEAASQFKDWNPRHFLDTAEMTAAFAIGYDWLYDAWTAREREWLRTAIERHGLEAGLEVYRTRPTWWPAAEHNWNVVCNGGLSIGALAVADECPQVAGEVLSRALASAPKCLSQFAPDGGWREGPGYWGYTTLYEAMFLASLETACGTDFGLGDLPGVDQAGWFPVYLNGPCGAFNFADAGQGITAGPQLLWMARRFGEPRYAEYQVEQKTGRPGALELLWGVAAARKPWQDVQTDRLFRGTSVATMRDRWDDISAWFVGFKAGSNAVNHSHLDVGSFVLDAKGVRWVIDLGPDDYNLPGYFGGKRWTYHRLRAEGHNTLVLEPTEGPDQDPKGSGTITTFKSSPRGVTLTADLSGAYPAARRATRSLTFVRGKSLRIDDAVKLKAPGEVWWFIHTRATAGASVDGRHLTLSQEGRLLGLNLLAPAGARFDVTPAGPLPTSPHPPNQASDDGVSRIAVHLSGVQDAVITAEFVGDD